VAEGIRSAGVGTPFTAHVLPECSPVDEYAGEGWLDVNVTYTYGIVHRKLLADWRREPVWPFFLIESTYEGEHDASELQIRRQAYWSVLSGGNGHCMGNHPIWLFGPGWRDALEGPGSLAMARWGAFFRDLDWASLEPDSDDRLVVAGRGEERGLDRATTAISTDGRLAVTYAPSRRPLTLDLAALEAGALTVTWFEPGSGLTVAGGVLRGAGRSVLTPPFAEDAVLVLRADGS
jgi:hypothetical protein